MINKFQKLVIDTKHQYLEDINHWLTINNALSITLEDNKDDPIYEPEPDTLPIWENVRISALFDLETNIELLINQLTYDFSKDIIEKYEYQQIEYTTKIEKYNFDPIAINKGKLWLYPYEQHPNDRVYINIEPGLAFGSGEHPTTLLCLEWLSENLPLKQKDANYPINIIDYGCGSGILSLAASKLNSSPAQKQDQSNKFNIYSIDNDPQAITSTIENAKRNNVNNIHALKPEEFSQNHSDIRADIIVANILANTLIELSDVILGKLKTHGKFVLSGILEQQVDEVTLTYMNKDAKITKINTKGAWVSIEGYKL